MRRRPRRSASRLAAMNALLPVRARRPARALCQGAGEPAPTPSSSTSRTRSRRRRKDSRARKRCAPGWRSRAAGSAGARQQRRQRVVCRRTLRWPARRAWPASCCPRPRAAGRHRALMRPARRVALLPLIESALGFHHALDLARQPGVERLLFGSIDFSVDLGLTEATRTLLVFPLAAGARVAPGRHPAAGRRRDHRARRQRAAQRRHPARAPPGFGGKLCIHPRQVAPVNAAFAPSAEEVAWAERVAGRLGSERWRRRGRRRTNGRPAGAAARAGPARAQALNRSPAARGPVSGSPRLQRRRRQ